MISINVTSPEANQPRLTCRIVRQWGAIFGEHQPGHVAGCTSCQAYFSAAQSLEKTLRSDAAQVSAEAFTASPALERNILRVVRISATNPVDSRRSFPIRAWAIGVFGAVAAVMAVVAAFVTLDRDSTSRVQPRLAETSTTEEAAVIIDTVETLSSELVDSVIPSAGEFVSKNPLQQELGMVYSDMRSALDFLKLNFLPTVSANAEPAEAQRI
jgi:hypothetical protein